MLDIRDLIQRPQLGEMTRKVTRDLGGGYRTVKNSFAWGRRGMDF